MLTKLHFELPSLLLLFFFWSPCAALRDLCSPTRDRTRTLWSGSLESQPLDLPGSPMNFLHCSMLYIEKTSTEGTVLMPCPDVLYGTGEPICHWLQTLGMTSSPKTFSSPGFLHLRYLEPDNSLPWGTHLCIVRCLAASLASYFSIPTPALLWWEPQIPPDFAKRLLGDKIVHSWEWLP